jgi:hypothetical protein
LVVLIPTVSEYVEARLNGHLWYDHKDFKMFHVELAYTLEKFMAKHSYTDKKKAFKLLAPDITFEEELYRQSVHSAVEPEHTSKHIWSMVHAV